MAVLFLPNSSDPDLTSFAGRLRWAMNEAKKNNMSGLAREIGVTPQNIQYLCNPKNNANGSEHVTKLALALNVNSDWLATGKGQPERRQDAKDVESGPTTLSRFSTALNDTKREPIYTPPADDVNPFFRTNEELAQYGEREQILNRRPGEIPVVGHAQLGDNGHFYDLEHPVGHGDGHINWPSRDENAYSLKCRGDSMKPRIRHGEFVVIEPNHQVSPGDEVLVKAKDGRVMVKQLAFIRDGMVYLDSVNESHPRVSILLEDVSAIHYVAGIAKSALWSPSLESRP